MTETEFTPQHLDFDDVYQGNGPFNSKVPWDIGRPQAAVVALADAGRFRGDVLDVGCGVGDNAAFLTTRGCRVTGVDGAPTAIRIARERAAAKGLEIEFLVGDVTRLDGLENRFDAVLDSALYHSLPEEQRSDYASALHRATRPGARLNLLCFSVQMPAAFPAPWRVTEQNLRDTLGPRWTIEALGVTTYETITTFADFVQQLRTLRPDLQDPEKELSEIKLDEHGNVRLPMWRLEAVRAG